MVFVCRLLQATAGALGVTLAQAMDFPDGTVSAQGMPQSAGLFMSLTGALASVISRHFFHHGFLGSPGWGAFVADVISFVIAGGGIAFTAIVAAPVLTRRRRRLGGPDGRSAAS